MQAKGTTEAGAPTERKPEQLLPREPPAHVLSAAQLEGDRWLLAAVPVPLHLGIVQVQNQASSPWVLERHG